MSDCLLIPWPNPLVEETFVDIHTRFFQDCPAEELSDPPPVVVMALVVTPICLIPVMVILVVFKTKNGDGSYWGSQVLVHSHQENHDFGPMLCLFSQLEDCLFTRRLLPLFNFTGELSEEWPSLTSLPALHFSAEFWNISSRENRSIDTSDPELIMSYSVADQRQTPWC